MRDFFPTFLSFLPILRKVIYYTLLPKMKFRQLENDKILMLTGFQGNHH